MKFLYDFLHNLFSKVKKAEIEVDKQPGGYLHIFLEFFIFWIIPFLIGVIIESISIINLPSNDFIGVRHIVGGLLTSFLYMLYWGFWKKK